MRAFLILALLGCTGCATFSYDRVLAFEPTSPAEVDALKVGESDIGEVLQRLGAPLYVWEGVDDAVVLAYGAEDTRGWGFSVSVPVDQTSVSFEYDDRAQRLEGYIFVFGDDDKLRIVRAGLLSDLRLSVRRPAAPVE